VQGKRVKTFKGQTSGAAYVDVQWNGTDEHGSPVASGVHVSGATGGLEMVLSPVRRQRRGKLL
jgi:flagellar hook assembly protein FlgD